MRDYLSIVYNRNTRPYTEYPRKLVDHLFNAFNLRRDMKILEPGCGYGDHLRLFEELGLEVFGLDLSPNSPSLGRGLNIKVCDIEKEGIPYPDNFFDVVYSKSFVEHLHDPESYMRETYRVLKPGGLMLSLTPDWEASYKKFYDDYTHVSPFTIVSLEGIKLFAGFDSVKVYKFRQLPIVWKYPALNTVCTLISPFIPVRTKIPFLRWSRELMLVGSAKKPKDV